MRTQNHAAHPQKRWVLLYLDTPAKSTSVHSQTKIKTVLEKGIICLSDIYMNLNMVFLSQLKIIGQFLFPHQTVLHKHTHTPTHPHKTQSTHLTAQTAHTSLPHHAEQLRLTWVLMTKEANPCLTVHTHKARVRRREGATALSMEDIKTSDTNIEKEKGRI